MRPFRWWFLSAGVAVAAAWFLPLTSAAPQPGAPPPSSSFEFGLIGNQGYTAEERDRRPPLVDDMNQAKLAFTVHDGGIGADPAACTDSYEVETRNLFNQFAAPLVYTPGDNEWLDCRHEGYDPQERLDSLRRTLFSTDQSLGRRTVHLDRQWPDYPENARWTYGPVVFATLHVVGSHDGAGRHPKGDSEFAARRAADIAWLNQTFDLAERESRAAVVLIWQADPLFGEDVPAYNGLRGALRARTIAFAKPVVLVHGGSGSFRIDKPMMDDSGRRVENFTRVETFGPADVHWVKATVDPGDRQVLTFRPEIVPANVLTASTEPRRGGT